MITTFIKPAHEILPRSQIWEERAQIQSVGEPIGFMQNHEGRIIALKGEPNFKSERVVNAMFGFHDDTRIATRVQLSPVTLENVNLSKGKYYDHLPAELKILLESNQILNTAQTNIATFIDLIDLEQSFFKSPKNFENKKFTLNSTPQSQYELIHYSFGKDETKGRTGVLVDKQTGKPVIVEIDGKEYIVEVKGCGLSKGGFGETTTRSGNPSIYGAVMPVQAVNEIENLDLERQKDGCKSGVAITGTFEGREVGYVIRLSPSSVRGSYCDHASFPNTKESGPEITKAYAYLLIQQLTCEKPFLMRNSAHHENIMISGNNNFQWTDYSDQLSIADNNPEFNNKEGFKKLVLQVFQGLSEVPNAELSSFNELLNLNARQNGIELGLKNLDSPADCFEKIWDEYLANRVYDFRKREDFQLIPDLDLSHKTTEINWETEMTNVQKKIAELVADEETAMEALPLLIKLNVAAQNMELYKFFSTLEEIHKVDMTVSMACYNSIDHNNQISNSYFEISKLIANEKVFLRDLIRLNPTDTKFVDAMDNLSQLEVTFKSLFDDGRKLIKQINSDPNFIASNLRVNYYHEQIA